MATYSSQMKMEVNKEAQIGVLKEQLHLLLFSSRGNVEVMHFKIVVERENLASA